MSVDTSRLIKALLWAGIEDYCALWQAVWEISALVPDLPEQEQADRARALVQTLFEQGEIELVWVEWAAIKPVDPSMAHQLMAQPDYWMPRGVHDRELCFITTESGEQQYTALA